MRAPLKLLCSCRSTSFGEPVDHQIGHVCVDLSGELDETRRNVEFARLPGQVERIDRDAVPAEAGAGIERHKAEGLGLGRVDDLPDIDAHRGVDLLQLVDERDVDGAKDVLRQLDRLGRRRRGNRHGPDDEGGIERIRHGERVRTVTTDDLGNVRCAEMRDCPGPPAPANRRGRSPSRFSAPSPAPGWAA